MIECCALCGGSTLWPLVERARTPVLQNAVYRDQGRALAAPRGKLTLVCCGDCGFVFNTEFDSALMEYGPNYENDQSNSQTFSQHMHDMADRVIAALPPSGGRIIEIGCGQGGFLVCLRQRPAAKTRVSYGFDPSYRGGSLPDGITVFRRPLDETVLAELGVNCDVIVSRHVIEHIPDPVGFLATIRRAVGNSGLLRLFLETPSFEWIIENHVLQDVFYEHVNYFTADTLALALGAAGFDTCSVSSVFAGQYLWADAACTGAEASRSPNGSSEHALAASRGYAADVEGQIAKWHQLLGDGRSAAIWGAGAKGVTFAGLIDPDHTRIDVLIDINPKKQDAFSATGHKIVAPHVAAQRSLSRVILMNPNYEREVRAILDAQNWHPILLGALL